MEKILKTLSGKDLLEFRCANNFYDGSRPVIAKGEKGVLIVSGSEEEDESAIISIYFDEDDGCKWGFKSFENKESALKDAKVLMYLLDEEFDESQLYRFGFEAIF